jgi:hypothetical protein
VDQRVSVGAVGELDFQGLERDGWDGVGTHDVGMVDRPPEAVFPLLT